MNYRFTIDPDKQFSTNKFYSGMHWTKRKKIADYYHKLIISQLKKKHELFTNPVCITMCFNNKFDIDNCSGMAKLIIDGMKGLLIVDDNRKYLKSLTLKFWEELGINIIIEDY